MDSGLPHPPPLMHFLYPNARLYLLLTLHCPVIPPPPYLLIPAITSCPPGASEDYATGAAPGHKRRLRQQSGSFTAPQGRRLQQDGYAGILFGPGGLAKQLRFLERKSKISGYRKEQIRQYYLREKNEGKYAAPEEEVEVEEAQVLEDATLTVTEGTADTSIIIDIGLVAGN